MPDAQRLSFRRDAAHHRRGPSPMRASLLTAVALAALGLRTSADDEATYLLTSDDVAQLKLVGIPEDKIAIKDKEVRLVGKPDGYFATRQTYKNYVLKFEWMYE